LSGTTTHNPKFAGDLLRPFENLKKRLLDLEYIESLGPYVHGFAESEIPQQLLSEPKVLIRTIRMSRDYKTPSEDCSISLNYWRVLMQIEEDGKIRTIGGVYRLFGGVSVENDKMIEPIKRAVGEAFEQEVLFKKIPPTKEEWHTVQSTTIPGEKITVV
jgi:hypothetical protein